VTIYRHPEFTENVPNFTEKRRSKIDELARRLSVVRMTVYRDIDKLKTKGLIERIWPDKGGYWRVIKK